MGLAHLAFTCTTRAELEQWTARLDELGIEHSDIDDQPSGSGVSFRHPDGIALDFFAPPGTCPWPTPSPGCSSSPAQAPIRPMPVSGGQARSAKLEP